MLKFFFPSNFETLHKHLTKHYYTSVYSNLKDLVYVHYQRYCYIIIGLITITTTVITNVISMTAIKRRNVNVIKQQQLTKHRFIAAALQPDAF